MSKEKKPKRKALAVGAVQEATELYRVQLFEGANVVAIQAKRVTMLPKDVKIVRQLRQEKPKEGYVDLFKKKRPDDDAEDKDKKN